MDTLRSWSDAGLLRALALAALAVFSTLAAQASDNVYTVANYPIEAQAENAVAAKEKALADGQQAAFRSLLKRLIPVTAYPAGQAAGVGQGGGPDRGRQGALGTQLVDRLHRELRLLLPGKGCSRSAPPRGHPVHRRPGAGRDAGSCLALGCRHSRRGRRLPGRTSGRGWTWKTRSRPSSCSHSRRASGPRRSTRLPPETEAPCARSRPSTTRNMCFWLSPSPTRRLAA